MPNNNNPIEPNNESNQQYAYRVCKEIQKHEEELRKIEDDIKKLGEEAGIDPKTGRKG